MTWTKPPAVPDHVAAAPTPQQQQLQQQHPGPMQQGGPMQGPGPNNHMPGPGPNHFGGPPQGNHQSMPNPNDPTVQKLQERENWVEYKTSEQVSFYCNIRTGKTTFKRPPELDIPKEQLEEEPEPQKIDVTKLAANTKRDKIQFKEIQTVVKTKENKPKQTSWVHQAKQEVEAIETQIAQKKSPPGMTEATYNTQEERIQAFKELLKDQGLTVKDKWETFLRKIIKDRRYQAIKTLKEKKVVFTRYQDEIAEAKQQSRKEAKRKLKQDYMDLLAEFPDQVRPNKRFRDFVSLIEKDARYKAVRSSDDRQRWAYDYIEDIERKEREKRESAKKALKDVLSTHEFTHSSTWRECEKEFGEHEAFKTKDLTHPQKKEVFQELIDDLRRAKEQEERKKREAKRQQEQKEEDDFVALLKEHSIAEFPLFHAKTQWTDYSALDEMKNDPRFTIFKDERKTTPYKRFEKFCWKLDSEMKNEKKTLKRVLRKEDFVVQPGHDIKILFDEVNAFAKESGISENHLKLLLLEMIAKAKFKEEQEAKKREKEKEREREREKERKEREKKRAERREKEREKEKKKDSSRSSKEEKEKKKKKRKREKNDDDESSRKKRKKEKKKEKRSKESKDSSRRKKDEKKCGKDSKKEVSEKSRSKETVAKEDKAENMVVDKEETTVEKEESAAEKSKVESEDGSGKTGMDVEPAEPSETSKESQQKMNKRTVEIMEVELAEKAEEVKENMEIETDAKEDESTQMPTDIPKQDSEEKPPTSLPPAEASTADASTSDDVSKDD